MPDVHEPEENGSHKPHHEVGSAAGGWRWVVRQHPLRIAGLSVLAVGLLGGLTFALDRYFTNHINRFGAEQSLVFQLDAPFGSVNLEAENNPNDIATVETLTEDAEAHNCQWSYGLNGTVGMLRIGIGTDEGMRSEPPIAMWRANSGFSLASSTAPQSDMGSPMLDRSSNEFSSDYQSSKRPSHSYFGSPAPLYGGFGYVGHFTPRTISTDAGSKVEVASPPGTQIYLTKSLPLAFSANLGFGQSRLDLSGLPLMNALIETGASQAYIYCMKPNPQTLHVCSVRAGLGQCTFQGISNLNAERFTFHGAVGSYHLGFEGRLTRNLDAVVELGLGMCSVSIPPTAGRVQVFYEDGLLS